MLEYRRCCRRGASAAVRRADNHETSVNASRNLRNQRRTVSLDDVRFRFDTSTPQFGTQCLKGFDHSWAPIERVNRLDSAIADVEGSRVRDSIIDRMECRKLRVGGPRFVDRGIEYCRRTKRLIDCDQDPLGCVTPSGN